LNAYTGYKASALLLNGQMQLVIDIANRFQSDLKCLNRIKQIYDEIGNKKEAEYNIDREFSGKNVSTYYTNQIKLFNISKVVFDKSPASFTFDRGNGVQISILDYFKQAYGITIRDPGQPLFAV